MADARRPNFLVLSPPKTGSSWLAANLRCHPQLFVPACKEVKYFTSFLDWFDLDWYLGHFASAGGRRKGEASPTYALLPVERIRLVRRLMPDVKLVFLMRDPIARAWSHARHNHRYREANFAGCTTPFAEVPDEQWHANFVHDWPLAGGDYLGQLQRWLSVFPREQHFVGFYERIAHDPAGLLRDVFAFLGVERDVDLSPFPLTERILEGPPGELSPALARSLHGLLHDRTCELADFLRAEFGLLPPPEWQGVLAPSAASAPGLAFARAWDDDYLAGVLAMEQSFPCDYPPMVVEGFHGYDIVFDRGRLVALARHLGRVRLAEVGEAELRRWQKGGDCIVASSLAEAKERVARRGRLVDRVRRWLRV